MTPFQQVFNELAAQVQKRLDAVPPTVVLDTREILDPDTAARQSWTLIARAVDHLRDTAALTPQVFAAAARKMSVRNAPLAVSVLAVNKDPSPPEVAVSQDPRACALQLLSAALGDMDASRRDIWKRLSTTFPLDVFDPSRGGTGTPSLRLSSVSGVAPHCARTLEDAARGAGQEDIVSFRIQMEKSFEQLMKSYAEACNDFGRMITAPQQKPAAPKIFLN